MATNTLEIITNKVEAFCGAHGQIQNFGFGTHYKIDTATRQYPLLWMFTRPSSIKNNALYLSFDILIVDILDGEESNMLHVMSETLQIAEDFVSYFGTWTGNGDENVRMDESNVAIEFVQHLLDNETAGTAMRVTFIAALPQNYCQIPWRNGSPLAY